MLLLLILTLEDWSRSQGLAQDWGVDWGSLWGGGGGGWGSGWGNGAWSGWNGGYNPWAWSGWQASPGIPGWWNTLAQTPSGEAPQIPAWSHA